MGNNPFSLDGRIILITGASSGIGKELAILCSRMGSKVVITGRNQKRLNDTFKQLEGEGHKMLIADLPNDIDHITNEITSVNGVVHSAGILNFVPYNFVTSQELSRVFDVNLISPVILTQRLLKSKKLEKDSSVVFISSIAGNVIAAKGNSAYSASKSALVGIMKVMALELAPKGIRVNSILPGMVRTELMNTFLESLTPEQIARDELKYPLGYGESSDVAFAAIYMLSAVSKWMTGTSLVIDGGFSLQ